MRVKKMTINMKTINAMIPPLCSETAQQGVRMPFFGHCIQNMDRQKDILSTSDLMFMGNL